MLKSEKELTPSANNDDFLADLHKTAESTTIPRDFDFRALAVQAVERYWVDRDKGLIDRNGEPTDETAFLHRIALRKFANPNREFITELLVSIGPSVFLTVLLWPFFSSSRKLIGFGRYVVPLAALVSVLVAVWVGIRFFLHSVEKERIEPYPLQHAIGATVGGLIAASLLLWTSGYGLQQRSASQTAKQESVETTLALASDRMLDVSRLTIERSLTTGNLEKAALDPGNIGLTNKKRLKVDTERVSPQSIVYRGEAEGVPGSLVATIANNSGSLKVETNEGTVEGKKFFVGTVERVSDHTLTLKLIGKEGKEITVNLSLEGYVRTPIQGETVFVVTDAEAYAATEVVHLGIEISRAGQ